MTRKGAPPSSGATSASVYLDDVLALDSSGSARLALEALDHVGTSAGVTEEDLERELIARVDVLHQIDDAHSSAAELAQHAVARSDHLGRRRAHWFS